MGHSGVHIEIYTDLGWILGVHWDLLWGHLGDILMICDTKVTVWVAGWVFRRFWCRRGRRKVMKSMVFTVWDTHCPLWKKVVFCIDLGLIVEVIWEPWDTFWWFGGVLETGWNLDRSVNPPRGWPKRVNRED